MAAMSPALDPAPETERLKVRTGTGLEFKWLIGTTRYQPHNIRVRYKVGTYYGSVIW